MTLLLWGDCLNSEAGTSVRELRSICQTKFSSLIRDAAESGTRPAITKIEARLEGVQPALAPDVALIRLIESIREENPELAHRVRSAMRRKASGGARALKIDLNHLPKKMADFIQGPFEKMTGPRGVSEPFVQIRALNDHELLIEHEEDLFPLLIRWTEGGLPSVRLSEAAGKRYQVLTIPNDLNSVKDLKLLEGDVQELIAGSRMNPYISGEKSKISQLASLLHDERLMTERPTQIEFNQLREKLDSNLEFRKAVPSLLFVAPTAAGKTRILGNFLKNKIEQAHGLLGGIQESKKLSVVMANTPDLVNQLALDLGKQLGTELPASKKFRMIQWGGQESEDLNLEGLQKFVDQSDDPVVLVTSYQTLAARIKSEAEMKNLFKKANGIAIDEVHNSGGETFRRVMKAGKEVARSDRSLPEGVTSSLDILGVTASPLSRVERTVELFDQSYWASLDSPGRFAKRAIREAKSQGLKPGNKVLEWIRIQKQFANARARGEINAPRNPSFFNPRSAGFEFDSLFKRSASGTQPKVDLDRLRQIWPTLAPEIADRGPGVIQAYPRDATDIARVLSELSGKNYVSLTGLNGTERDAVTKAFQTQTVYQGRSVDAIVGRIREGLDFPAASWYLSFKKYVKFPETVQGQGRVVRLNLDKPTPSIIYFGEDLDSMAFRDVRDLVLQKTGPLPRKLAQGRGFKGARLPRNTHPDSKLGSAMSELNVAIEAMFRMKPDWAKLFSNPEKIDPAGIRSFQEELFNYRHSQQNPEIASALKDFIYQVNGFPFFQGNLESTWKLCEKIQRALKSGKPYSNRLSEAELAILNDPRQLEQIQEFRAMKSWLGPISRSILESLPLRPNGIRELSETLNAFVARNGRPPLPLGQDMSHLRASMEQAMGGNSDDLYDHLSYTSRVVLGPLFEEKSKVPFEAHLEERFEKRGSIPDFFFDKMEEGADITLEDRLDHSMAQKLQAGLHHGSLDLRGLSSGFLKQMDEGNLYAGIIRNISLALSHVLNELKEQGLGTQLLKKKITWDELVKHQEFGCLRVVKKLAEQGYPHSIEYQQGIEALLSELTRYEK